MPQPIHHTTYANEEVNEVLGSTPSFLVRTGNALLLALVALVFTLAAFITYPDVIEGTVNIQPRKLSLVTAPAVESTLAALYVREGDTVSTGSQLLTVAATDGTTRDTLKATMSGVVVFQRFLHIHDLLDAGTPLMTIHNPNNNYTVVIHIRSHGAGKIQPGQQVYISLDKFPKEEFGELTGQVISRPRYDSAGNTILEAVVTKNTTTYGRQPDIGTGAIGFTSIVTGRKSFLAQLLP